MPGRNIRTWDWSRVEMLASQEHPLPVSCWSLPLPVSTPAGQAVSLDTMIPSHCQGVSPNSCLPRSSDEGQVRGVCM